MAAKKGKNEEVTHTQTSYRARNFTHQLTSFVLCCLINSLSLIGNSKRLGYCRIDEK